MSDRWDNEPRLAWTPWAIIDGGLAGFRITSRGREQIDWRLAEIY
jgi:hypothetical protein